jgi:hypothetical protein
VIRDVDEVDHRWRKETTNCDQTYQRHTAGKNSLDMYDNKHLKKNNCNLCRRSWNDLSSRQTPLICTPPSSDSSSEPIQSPQPPTIRKPVRIVKAVQRSPPTINESTSPNRPLSTSKTYLLAKPGLFSASPINSSQKLPIKSFNSTRHIPSRDENDIQLSVKEFAQRYPQNHLLNQLTHLIISNGHHLSTDYTRALFPIPDHLRRIRSRQSSGGDTNSYTNSSNSSSDYTHRTVSNDSCIFDDDTLRQMVKERRTKSMIFYLFFLFFRKIYSSI